MSKKTFNEAEIDQIIKAVDETVVLAKSAAAKDMSDGANGGLKKDAIAPEAAPAPEAKAPEMEAPAPEAPAPEADDHISDEELLEIYQNMPPEEKERHFMMLREAMGAEGGEQPAEEAPAPEMAPAPEAAPAMPEAMKSEKKEEKHMEKSEDKAALEAAQKEIEDLKKSLERVVGAFESAVKPTRKSVAGLDYLAKGESQAEGKSLSKSEKKEKISELAKSSTSLTKNDRLAINDFILNGGSEDKINQLLTGGK